MKHKLLSTAIVFLAVAGCTATAPSSEQTRSTSPQAAQASPSSGTLTPAENNEIAARMFEGAWNAGDFSVIDQLIEPNALDHSPLSTETGSDGFKKIIGTFRAALPNLKMMIEDEVYAGDRVVHRWKIQGNHTGEALFGVPANDKEITLTGITIVRMENGKIAERWTQLDQLGLMQQLGLIPSPGQ